MSARIALVSVAIFVLGLVLSTSAFEFKDCSKNGSKLNSVKVSACPYAKGPYCLINYEGATTYSANFTTGVEFEEVWVGIASGRFRTWRDGCMKGLKCPAAAGSVQSFTTQLETASMNFDVNGPQQLQLFVLDKQSDEFVFCVEFPVRVVHNV